MDCAWEVVYSKVQEVRGQKLRIWLQCCNK